MILALRRRHRRLFAVLGVVLPIGLAAGIAGRKPVPTVSILAPELGVAARSGSATIWERDDLFPKLRVKVRLSREAGGRDSICLMADEGFAKPDVIVYWYAGAATAIDAVPDHAVLLGAFSAAALPLPKESANSSGSLVLYSLADNEIVGVSKSISFDTPAH